jgi:hypothetical protein
MLSQRDSPQFDVSRASARYGCGLLQAHVNSWRRETLIEKAASPDSALGVISVLLSSLVAFGGEPDMAPLVAGSIQSRLTRTGH